MHFHVPLWVYKALAAIGGFGVLFREAIKPLLNSIAEVFLQRRDKPVWLILKEPKYRLSHVSNGVPYYSQDEIPYSLKDIREKLQRSERSINRSLSRLEGRGKVKEVAGGWKRKET